MTAVPQPVPDLDTQAYWDGLAVGELRIQRCLRCRRFQHFPGPICSSCLSFDLDFEVVSGRGTVYSFVIIHRAISAAFAPAVPYAVAWVELAEQAGLRVLADITGCDPAEVTVGLDVCVVFEAGLVLPRFRPYTGEQQ